MQLVTWSPHISIQPPVYLDANILVGYLIRGHRLYRAASQVVAEILASQSQLVISSLVMQESLWGIVAASWYEMIRQPPKDAFTLTIYNRWKDKLLKTYGPRFTALSTTVKSWADAGHPISVIPATQDELISITSEAPTFMRQLRLPPADAFHMSSAVAGAKTFITSDAAFNNASVNSLPGSLVVLYVT